MRDFSPEILDHLRVNSLERPYDPQSEPLPETWTADHLSRRLVDCFTTLKRLPRERGPRQPGNHGPAYVHSALDIRGWDNPENVTPAVAALGNPFDERKRELNADRLPPSKADIARMEACNEFLRSYRASDPAGASVLARWAMAIAFNVSVERQAVALQMSKRSFYSKRVNALKACAAMLNARRETVF
jgi:hypothetical protein